MARMHICRWRLGQLPQTSLDRRPVEPQAKPLPAIDVSQKTSSFMEKQNCVRRDALGGFEKGQQQ